MTGLRRLLAHCLSLPTQGAIAGPLPRFLLLPVDTFTVDIVVLKHSVHG